MDAATRGSLLHDALSRFFGHAAERLGTPVLLRAEHAAIAIPLAEQSLDEALVDARGKKWLGSELLLGPKRLELWRILRGYVEWEIELNERMFKTGAGILPKRIRMGVQSHELRWARSSSPVATSGSGSAASSTGSRSGWMTGSTRRDSWPRWTTRRPLLVPRCREEGGLGRRRRAPGAALRLRDREQMARHAHGAGREPGPQEAPGGALARAVQVRQGLARCGRGS